MEAAGVLAAGLHARQPRDSPDFRAGHRGGRPYRESDSENVKWTGAVKITVQQRHTAADCLSLIHI